MVNTWLNLAIIWEVLLLVLIVYLLVLHAPFGTYSLPPINRSVVLALALTVIPMLAIAKWVIQCRGESENGV